MLTEWDFGGCRRASRFVPPFGAARRATVDYQHQLMRRSVGFVAVHLLASVRLSTAMLRTRERLAAVVTELVCALAAGDFALNICASTFDCLVVGNGCCVFESGLTPTK